MKKFIHVLVLVSLLFVTTMVVSAEETDTVTLNLENGDIDITPTGYKQNSGQEVAFTGEYIITGSRTSDTPLDIINNSGHEVTFNITLDNAEIIGAEWNTALRISGNSPINLTLYNIGESKIMGYNHPAICNNNPSDVYVNVYDCGDSKITLSRQDGVQNSPIVFSEGQSNFKTTVNGEVPDNFSTYTSHTHAFKAEDYTADGNATCKTDGTKSARCSASETCWAFDTINDVGSKKHLFESGVCPFCGLHGTVLQTEEITWLKYEMNGSTSWFGIDNRNGEFEDGSYMWIECISSKDETAYNTCWNQLDAKHKNNIEADNYKMFQIGVTKKDGTEYTILDEDKPVSLYVQIPTDWDKDDLKAAFISSETDEDVTLNSPEYIDYTEGKEQFATLTLKHFSPYIVYDELTVPETGDNQLAPMVLLFVLSCAVFVYTSKQSYRKTHR